MRGVQVAFLVVLVVGLSVSAAAQLATGPCLPSCLVDACQGARCQANEEWQCRTNPCTCGPEWTYGMTGLKLSYCPPVSCPEVKAPVCAGTGGGDLKTYPSACHATIQGIEIAYTGKCKCRTTASSAPVCGRDGKSYNSKCLALSAGTDVAYLGKCLLPADCDNKKYNPVCDSTGLVWTNACVAKLNSIARFTPITSTSPPCVKGQLTCVMCEPGTGCDAPHRCKGNKRYTCDVATCENEGHVLNNGQRTTYGACKPIYKFADSGFPAAACLKPL